MKLGIVGLGRMGAGMRERLRRGGHDVVGFDLDLNVSDVESLESLVDVGLVKPIHLGHAATRFDASTEEHAHFRCVTCNAILDVPVEHLPEAGAGLDRCEIIGSSVEFYGFCTRCRRHKLGLAPD